MKNKRRLVSTSELERRDSEIMMTPAMVEELVEYWDTFKIFVKKKIHEIQARLWMWQLKWQEANAYIIINWYIELMESIDETASSLKEYKERLNQ